MNLSQTRDQAWVGRVEGRGLHWEALLGNHGEAMVYSQTQGMHQKEKVMLPSLSTSNFIHLEYVNWQPIVIFDIFWALMIYKACFWISRAVWDTLFATKMFTVQFHLSLLAMLLPRGKLFLRKKNTLKDCKLPQQGILQRWQLDLGFRHW
jgi:hypothetical protein